MGGHLTKEGWLTQVAHQVAHAFDHHNASLSEGAPRCCGRGLAWKALLEAGWRGFPEEGETSGGIAAAEPGDAWRTWGRGSPPMPITLGTGRALRPAIDRADPTSATGYRANQNVPRQDDLRFRSDD